jgi:hypothetical protein
MENKETIKVIKNGYFWYVDAVKGDVDESYDGEVYTMMRPRQLRKVTDILINEFDFDTVNCIETGGSWNIKGDGAVGLYLAHLCKETGGEFHSVELNEDIKVLSEKMYQDKGFDNVNHHHQDSVKYLENTEFIPNLVHLDSWDVDLKNPLPSGLHGWREFIALKDKMPVGSIIIIDDCWFNDSWVEWVTYEEDSEEEKREIIDISYPILGKGSLIWHYINDSSDSNMDWKIIGDGYNGGEARKLIIKKIQ